MEERLTAAQQKTLPARQALAARFSSPQERSEYFRELARLSHRKRLVLSAEEAAALGDVSALLTRILERVQPQSPEGVLR
jgi:hypothetical protein